MNRFGFKVSLNPRRNPLSSVTSVVFALPNKAFCNRDTPPLTEASVFCATNNVDEAAKRRRTAGIDFRCTLYVTNLSKEPFQTLTAEAPRSIFQAL
jgi:hypothetical protein